MQVPALTFYLVSGPLTPTQVDNNFHILQDFSNGLANLVGAFVNDDGTLKSGIIGAAQIIPGSITAVAFADQSITPQKIGNTIAGPGLIKTNNIDPISVNVDAVTVGFVTAAGTSSGQLYFQTNPINGDTLAIVINATSIPIQFVSAIGAVAGNVLIGTTAAATLNNLLGLIQSPGTTSTTQVAVSVPNQTLLGYTAFSLTGTTVTIGDNGGGLLTTITMTPSTSGIIWTTYTSSKLGAYGAGSHAILDDSVASGTDGGTLTSGAWQKRPLTTLVRNQNSFVVSYTAGGTFVLQAGTYRAQIWATGFAVGSHKIRLYNATDASDVLIGTNAACPAATASMSFITGVFTIGAAKNLQVDHRCSTTNAGDGLGAAVSFSVNEVYMQIQLWKES